MFCVHLRPASPAGWGRSGLTYRGLSDFGCGMGEELWYIIIIVNSRNQLTRPVSCCRLWSVLVREMSSQDSGTDAAPSKPTALSDVTHPRKRPSQHLSYSVLSNFFWVLCRAESIVDCLFGSTVSIDKMWALFKPFLCDHHFGHLHNSHEVWPSVWPCDLFAYNEFFCVTYEITNKFKEVWH